MEMGFVLGKEKAIPPEKVLVSRAIWFAAGDTRKQLAVWPTVFYKWLIVPVTWA